MKREDDINLLVFIRRICLIGGTWPYQTPFQKFIRTFIVHVCIINIYFVQIANFLSTEISMESSIRSIPYMFTTFSISFTYYAGLFNKKLISHCLMQMINNVRNIKPTKEYDVIHNYASICKKCIFMFILSYNSYISLLFLISIRPLLLDVIIPLNETRPHVLIFPMNWYNEQEKYFMKLLLFQYVSLIVIGIAMISSFSMYLSSLQYVCAMFRIIGCLLDNILENKRKKLKIIDDDEVYVRIIRIIQMHNKTIEFIDLINKKFNVFYLVMMMYALCYIGISIVQLLDEYEKQSNMVMLNLSMVYIIFQIVWGFTFCYIGQHLQNVSEAIFCKAYAIPWYLLSRKSQILVFFVIMRAAKPSYVWIGKTFIASLEFFAGLVRLSISYAMVLHSLR